MVIDNAWTLQWPLQFSKTIFLRERDEKRERERKITCEVIINGLTGMLE